MPNENIPLLLDNWRVTEYKCSIHASGIWYGHLSYQQSVNFQPVHPWSVAHYRNFALFPPVARFITKTAVIRRQKREKGQSLSSWQFWKFAGVLLEKQIYQQHSGQIVTVLLFWHLGNTDRYINSEVLLKSTPCNWFYWPVQYIQCINFDLQMCAWSPLFLTGHGLTLTLFPICPVGQVEEKSTQPAPLLGCPNILPNTLTQ